MDSEQEKDLFFEALRLDPERRDAFLNDRCADAEARERIRRLVDAHEQARHFMASPTAPVSAREGASEPVETEEPGTRVGPYVLESLLGEGGFGRVFLARQTSPVTRTVALKLIKPGMDSRSVISRFESERQALAMMDHPNVARVFDAGQTPRGRPYFVMEYVRGEPITAYCDRNRLDLRRRLALFEQVCLAVQHAHQKGIIHRDIKPSNVIVSEIDGVPTPKVIDFGIAKAIEPETLERSLITRHDQLIGTPAYMSPEQIAGARGIDTRTDVYSLGAMLYELLTGHAPFDPERLRDASFATLEKIICEEVPPRPSARIARDDGDGVRTAAARRTSPSHLARSLRGDLDWIVLRAMEKDPVRRYATANAMAQDIRHHLASEPVVAGPPSRLYRFSKFARRNRVELAAASIVLVALLALFVSVAVFAARAETELQKTRAIAGFTGDMLSGLDPAVARGADTTLFKQILADAVARIENEPPDIPEVEAQLRNLIGTAYYKIASFEDAMSQFQRAASVAERTLGPRHDTTLEIRQAIGEVLVQTSRFDEARPIFEEVLEARLSTSGPNSADAATAIYNLAFLDRVTGNFERARQGFERALRIRANRLGDNHPDTMSVRNSLATVLGELGEHDRSITLFRQVIDFQREELGEDHPHTLATMNNLASAYGETGRHDEAIRILQRVLEIKRRILEPEHPSLVIALNNLAQEYARAGRLAEAESLLREATGISRAAFGERDRRTLILMNNLAGNLQKQGRPGEALPLVRAALPPAEEVCGMAHPLTLALLSHLAGLQHESGAHADSFETAAELLRRADDALPPGDGNRARYRIIFARAALDTGRLEEADEALRAAITLIESDAGADPADRAEAARLLARVCEQTGRTDEAARWTAIADGEPSEPDA